MSIVESSMSGVRVPEVGILLIEDDHGDAVLVQACLAEVGVREDELVWARSLVEARAAIADEPGCILLDLGLPDAAGFDAVGDVVAMAPQAAVIVLTGRRGSDGARAIAAGAQDFLAKDALSAELLERSIRYAVERQRAKAVQQQLVEMRVSAAEQRRLERGLLPTPLLRTDAVRCTTYYQPGRNDAVLGGDFFDVVETTEGRIRAVIGDVMGHGPDEAALGVHLRVAWRTLLLAGTPDDQILPTMSVLLNSEPDAAKRFATVCDVTIEGESMSVRLAGHPAPVVCTADDAAYLDAVVGLPLGVRLGTAPARGWPSTQVRVRPGSSILLYTDGLLDSYTTASAPDGLGIPELVDATATCAGSGTDPASWLPTLLAAAPGAAVDDTAAMVITVAPRR